LSDRQIDGLGGIGRERIRGTVYGVHTLYAVNSVRSCSNTV